MRKLGFYIRESFTAIRRNGVIAFAAVSTAFIALLLLGFALLMQREVNLLVAQTEANVQVSVYLDDNISLAQQTNLQQLIQHMPQVSTVRYESKEQAYQNFKVLFSNQQALVNNVSPDALPASFRVELKDPQQFHAVSVQLQGQPGIKNIFDLRDFYTRLFAVTRVFRWGAVLIAAIMLVSSAALIGNTVRMAVFDRRQEIGIMRLVGATNWTIRVPFLVEGLVEGLLGAGIAVAGLFITKRAFIDPLRNKIGFLALVGNHDVIWAVYWMLPAAVLVSILASVIATSRWLEV